MSTARLIRIAVLLVPLAAAACTQENPGFVVVGEDETGAGSTAALVSATSGGGPGSSSGGEGESAGDASTAAVLTTGDGATGDGPGSSESGGESGSSESGSGGSSGGDGEPGSLEVPATLASCALLSAGPALHAGPTICEAIADIQGAKPTGLMLLDSAVSYNGGGERPAHVFLRFDVPAALADKELVAVSLALQVDDSLAASSRAAGSVHLSADFDLVALEFTAPALGVPLAVSEDVPQAGSVVSWEIDPSLVVPGAALFLRIAPDSDDGVLYLGGAAPPELRPRLRVDYL